VSHAYLHEAYMFPDGISCYQLNFVFHYLVGLLVCLKVNTEHLYFYSLCNCACLQCGLYNVSKFIQNNQGSKVILL
jgi:hypothetical protein